MGDLVSSPYFVEYLRSSGDEMLKLKAMRLTLLITAFLLTALGPASADFGRSEQWFNSLKDEARAGIQVDLTLAGYYDALVDGTFGPATYKAITNFQRRIGASPSGIINDSTFRALQQRSEAVFSELGMQVLQDGGIGLDVVIPRALLPETKSMERGTSYTRADGEMRIDTIKIIHQSKSISAYYQSLKQGVDGRRVIYSTINDEFFAVSGSLDGQFFYSFMVLGELQSVGFTLTWSSEYESQGSILAPFLASYISTWNEPSQSVTPEPSQQTVLPPSNSSGEIAIGNFLVFKDMPGVIGLEGRIEAGAALDFRRAVKAAGTPKILVLASDGGRVWDALLVAYQVRELGLATYVLPDTGCYSACSFVFLAGQERFAEGSLGVHQVWGDEVNASAAQTVVSDILEAFADFGVQQEVTSAMLRTLPEDMYVFSPAELSDWGVNSGDPKALLLQKPAKSKVGRPLDLNVERPLDIGLMPHPHRVE